MRLRRGLTLIEVVAAIAILGTVLVGIVLSRARHTHQLALSQRKLAAVHAADALLSDWWTSPGGVPVDRRGTPPNDATLRWQTRYIDNHHIEELGARVLRVELFDAIGRSAPMTRDAKEPLVVVDLVVPDPDRAAKTRRGERAAINKGGRR